MASQSKAARQSAAVVYLPRDRRGDVRRQTPQGRKQRAYERRFVSKFTNEEGSRHAPSRHLARQALAIARREQGEAQERWASEADALRVRSPGDKKRYVWAYNRSVGWHSTRFVMTTRERIEETTRRQVEWVGTRHFAAMSYPSWGRWSRRGGLSIGTAEYRQHLVAFFGSLMQGRTIRSLRLARWLDTLLNDTSRTIPVSPDNRWSGSLTWKPAWLRQFLDLNPWLASALSAWHQELERLHGARLDAWLASVERDGRRALRPPRARGLRRAAAAPGYLQSPPALNPCNTAPHCALVATRCSHDDFWSAFWTCGQQADSSARARMFGPRSVEHQRRCARATCPARECFPRTLDDQGQPGRNDKKGANTMRIPLPPAHVSLSVLAILSIFSCTDSDDTGSTGPRVIREGASQGAVCKSRDDCAESSDLPITCGCTGQMTQAQCTPFGKEGDTCESDTDADFDLRHPLCGAGLKCERAPGTQTATCTKRKKLGEACERGNCESDLWCKQGICTAEKIPLGEPCEYGDDQPCAPPNHCEFKQNATCVAPLPIGAECEPRPGINDPCRPDGACPDYVVSPATFQCRPALKDGQACGSASLCLSGVCQQGTCGLRKCQIASP